MATAQSTSTDRPWMTALEMQFAALRRVRLTQSTDERLDKTDKDTLLAQTIILRRSPAYAWTDETTTAALMASKTIPHETVLSHENLPPELAGWWWFEKPVCTVETPGAGVRDIVALAWGTSGDPEAKAIMIVGFVIDDSGLPTSTSTFVWRFGATVQQMIDIGNPDNNKENLPKVPTSVSALARLFLAGHVWMNQRILSMSSGPVERHRRKQLAREYDAVVSDVKVIQLRRTESQQRPKDTENAEPVEWSCRWIVNGHWRNQPYANGEHKLIYILPYVKGPDDKPLKVPTHTVYSVNR